MIRRLTIPLLLIVPLATSMAYSADKTIDAKSWPNWMGPNRDGISQETGWSSAWPDDDLPVAWSAEIGIGFSSISIDRGRLFTMGHIDGEEFVWCLDANTGHEIWKHRYPGELMDNLHEGGPGSTPTIEGDRVYTLGKEGQFYCLDFDTGKVLWEKRLQEDLDVPLPEWGFASSAMIDGNQLLLQGGRVVSYDKRNGNKIWQTPTHAAGYGSAAIFTHENKVQYAATLDCESFRVLRLDDGSEVDSAPWPSPYGTNSTTPIVAGRYIFVSTAYNVGCALYEFDGKRLKHLYSKREMRNHFNNSILHDGYLYGFDGNSNLGRVVQLTCMKLDSGDVAWKQRGMGCGSLMIADGKLLILGERGELILAKATHTGYEELSRSAFLNGRCWTVPVLLNKRVYGRNAAGHLVCVELPNAN